MGFGRLTDRLPVGIGTLSVLSPKRSPRKVGNADHRDH